jgi:predicted HNH restriction endonuclease
MSNLVTLCNACHEAVHRGDLKITSTMEFERKEGWKLK